MADRWRLGLGGSDHDFSAALALGSDIRVAIEQERLTRVKNGLSIWYREPTAAAVDYCLRAEGVDLAEVDEIVGCDTLPARTREAYAGSRLKLFPHHLCHAASAYLMMPPGTRAAILVYDGYGSIVGPGGADRALRETVSFHRFSDAGTKTLGTTCGSAYVERDDFPIAVANSVGMLYELATQILGYGPLDAGKTMGLAAYGRPLHVDALLDFARFGDDRADCFRCPTDRSEIADLMEAKLRSGGGGFPAKADLAASVQAVVECALVRFVAMLDLSDVEAIAVSGGCGLNSVANARLAAAAPRGLPVFVPPHCGDAGLGLGALWLSEREERCGPSTFTFRGDAPAPSLSRPGRLYGAGEIAEAANAFYPRLTLESSAISPHEVAALLARGDLLGVFNGRSEMGPRALGGRSILADPRLIATRERLNRLVKRREPFRPLAPLVLASEYDGWFEDRRRADAYMLRVAAATPRCRREAPGVLHVDGTARVQLVDEAGDPWLAEVLQAFARLTGVPILVSTSFNRRGEPIVETPEDAMDAFLGLGLDGLYADGRLYRDAGALVGRLATDPT